MDELGKDPLENWLEQKLIIDDAMNALNEAGGDSQPGSLDLAE